MKKVAITLAAGVLSLGLSAGIARAQDSTKPDTTKQDMNAAGQETKSGAKDVGHGTATAAKGVAHGTATGAKKVGSTTKNTTKKVLHTGAKKTDEGATKVENKTAPQPQ
jgi:hypothetical protein